MATLRILVIDDDSDVGAFVRAACRGHDVDVSVAVSGVDGIRQAERARPDLILLDLVLPDIEGGEVLNRLRQRNLPSAVVLVTSHASLESTVACIRAGADDVIGKPLRIKALLELVERYRSALHESSDSVEPSAEPDLVGPIAGQCRAMVAVYDAVARVAARECNVLITGETGTGKELVARAIHRFSGRKGEFVAINCAAVPDALLESELFGHEKGAFTGAVGARAGRLERAAGGTLLLDEVGDMPLHLQPKLLRVLEERVIERVGGHTSRPLDARLIAATHQDLDAYVAESRFRADLFYRLAVFTIRLPPLRERTGDIPLLVNHYVQHLAPRINPIVESVHPNVYDRLEKHSWPGNARELRNVVERGLVMARGSMLQAADLPELVMPAAAATAPTNVESLDDVEWDCIQRTLEECNGRRSEAARRLGIHRNTLLRKIKSRQASGSARAGQ